MVETRPEKSQSGVTRRRFTFGVVLGSVAAAFGSLFTLLKVLSPEQKGGGYVATVEAGDGLVYAEGANAGTAVQASAMKVGEEVLAYPAGKTSNPANIVQLVKLDESAFKPPTRMELTDQGFVAYSAICTHLGCTVSWVRNEQAPAASVTECFCHNSIFDPSAGAKVLGGPAPIPLAQIGIKVKEDGTIVFTGGFSGPIGPQV